MIADRSSPSFFFFFFNDPAPPDISPLPLPDALPIPRSSICTPMASRPSPDVLPTRPDVTSTFSVASSPPDVSAHTSRSSRRVTVSARSRSEEHTSELQSQSNLVCRLLLEKKKKHTYS